jgi:G3E family GTPase
MSSDQRVPTNIVTGLLGAGKTSLIRHLLEQSPAGERWAVLVNEMGEVGIDEALLAGTGMEVRELPGGCLCCTLGVPFRVAIVDLLRRVRPDRLIIEPTGIGHPAELVDRLQDAELGAAVSLETILTVIDPRRLADERVPALAVFRNQVQLADGLVASHGDRCSDEDWDRFRALASGCYPPKALVADAREARANWLGMAGGPRTVLTEGHHDHAHDATTTTTAVPAPEPGQPARYANDQSQPPACGWIWDPADCFDYDALIAVLGGLGGLSRLKGVFRTNRGWFAMQGDGDAINVERSVWRRDSRLELIAADRPLEWQAVEASLERALKALS